MVAGRCWFCAPADDISAAVKIAPKNRFRRCRICYFPFRTPVASLRIVRKHNMIVEMHAKAPKRRLNAFAMNA